MLFSVAVQYGVSAGILLCCTSDAGRPHQARKGVAFAS